MPEIIMPTPHLDEIPILRWFAKDLKYDFDQLTEIDGLLDNHVWVTKQRIQIPVRKMTTNHINNCIRCWNGAGRSYIPPGYLGGKDKWLKIFNQELLNRQ